MKSYKWKFDISYCLPSKKFVWHWLFSFYWGAHSRYIRILGLALYFHTVAIFPYVRIQINPIKCKHKYRYKEYGRYIGHRICIKCGHDMDEENEREIIR